MRKPLLRNPARRMHRPSAAMCVSLVALFVALSGGAYAAVTIPAKSIGATQLKSFAVTNPKLGVSSVGSRKIMPGAVGDYRVNRNEVQLRVTGTCTGTDQAITSVSVSGTTTCGTSSPAESDSGVGKQTTIATGTTATSLASYSIAGGTAYEVHADPSIEVSGTAAGIAGAHVLVTCTLAAGTSTTAVDTENVTVNVDAAGDPEYASVPLNLIAPTNANAETATLGCTQVTSGTNTVAPTVAGTGRIYALGVTPATTTTTAAAVRH
jgi:hypothetical protein